jgi:hypothetical protein
LLRRLFCTFVLIIWVVPWQYHQGRTKETSFMRFVTTCGMNHTSSESAQMVCTGWRRNQDHWKMSLIIICRTLWGIPYSCKNLAKWIFLANHVWRHDGFYLEVWSILEAWEHQFKRCHSTHQQPPDQTLRWLGIDCMGPFPKSNNCEYILMAVDYVSKLVEAMPCRAVDSRSSKKMFEEKYFQDLVSQEWWLVMEDLTSLTKAFNGIC